MVKDDMDFFVQYQTARAMRDAVKQDGGLAGLGAGFAFGNAITQNAQSFSNSDSQNRNKADQLREIKKLLDEGILTQEEFETEKKRILNK